MFDLKDSPSTWGYTGHSRLWHATPLCTTTPYVPYHLHTHKDSRAHAHTHTNTHLDVIYSDTFTMCTRTHTGMHRHPWRLLHTHPRGMF